MIHEFYISWGKQDLEVGIEKRDEVSSKDYMGYFLFVVFFFFL